MRDESKSILVWEKILIFNINRDFYLDVYTILDRI